MNKIICAFILSVLSATSFSQKVMQENELSKFSSKNGIDTFKLSGNLFTGIITSSYANGKLLQWKEIKNGLYNGLFQEWYENGYLKFAAFWKDGKGHGSWKYFHDNGRLRQDEFYDMDIPIGNHFEYYNKGILKTKRSYIKGKKEGT